MITNSELQISNESYTHKDFYQIYPEILEIVSKLTNLWAPSSSNESDPGNVLLKLLAFIGDKLNYNIDKNELESFMPSLTQEDSMRKLCDMMSYDMHYYQSAITKVNFMWNGKQLPDKTSLVAPEGKIVIPKFTTIITDDAVNNIFTLTQNIELTYRYEVKQGLAIQGQLVKLEINDDNILRLSNLDSNYRFYLPEKQIAENGIWIQDSTKVNSDIYWEKVNNLNNQVSNQQIWKFGYDSKKKLPYIQFPDDVSVLLKDGVYVNYIKTNGKDGNISSKILTKIKAQEVNFIYSDESIPNKALAINENNDCYLIVQNTFATTNGKDCETIDEAYQNYKKIGGTFNTLIACRDYANAIYNMMNEDKDDNIVSNVQVTDYRDDINKVNRIVTLNDYGLIYKDYPEKILDSNNNEVDAINHFDLFLYPLNSIKENNIKESYEKSFKPNLTNWYEILSELDNNKTISHNIRNIATEKTNENEIYLLKNYYKLYAKIATTYKVSNTEALQIKENIYKALYKNFNARKLDYGEDIPYDSIANVIKNSDVRIKFVSLEEPEIHTKYMLSDGKEYNLKPLDSGLAYNTATDLAKKEADLYNRLVAKNVLAGRIPLFNYDSTINYAYGRANPDNTNYNRIFGRKRTYPKNEAALLAQTNDIDYSITHLKGDLKINTSATKGILLSTYYKLQTNEAIQLMAPNLRTTLIYPTNVNYYLNINSGLLSNLYISCKLTNIDDYNNATNTLSTTEQKFDDLIANNKDVYKQSTYADASAVPGMLVDKNGYTYLKATEYELGYKYYAKINTEDTIGNNAVNEKFIQADSEYKLKTGEELIVNYTDSEGEEHYVRYTGNDNGLGKVITYDKNGIQLSSEDNINIIRANFNVYPFSDWAKNHVYVKQNNALNLKGMFQLTNSQEIDIRDFVKSDLKDISKCYWITDDNQLTFTYNPSLSNVADKKYVYEYLLNSGEYFFYTDSGMTSLATFGSGTRLRLTKSNNSAGTKIVWKIDSSKVCNIESIGDYSDIYWQNLPFTKTDYLTIQEMQLITLTEGDKISNVSITDTSNPSDVTLTDWQSYIDSNWKALDIKKFSYNGKTLLEACNVADFTWHIRALLLINMSKNSPLKLINSSSSTQSISLYTSAWKLDDGEEIDLTADSDLYKTRKDDLVEINLINKPIITLSNISICSSSPIQSFGDKLINTHIYNVDGDILDDFKIVPFKESTSLTNINFHNFSESFTKVSFDKQLTASAQVFIPKNEYALISIYYNTINVEDTKKRVVIKTDNIQTILTNYNEETIRDANNYLVLHPGLNTLKLTKGTNLTIDGTNDLSAVLVLSDIYVINTDEDSLGLNYKLLGLSKNEGERFLNQLKALDRYKVFYYTNAIDNSIYLDVDSMNTASAWTNKNNVCHKFIISELDVNSFTNIDIAKSSRVTK